MKKTYEVMKVKTWDYPKMLWTEYEENINNAEIHIFKNIKEMKEYCGIKSNKEFSRSNLFMRNRCWDWEYYTEDGYTFIVRKVGFHSDEQKLLSFLYESCGNLYEYIGNNGKQAIFSNITNGDAIYIRTDNIENYFENIVKRK